MRIEIRITKQLQVRPAALHTIRQTHLILHSQRLVFQIQRVSNLAEFCGIYVRVSVASSQSRKEAFEGRSDRIPESIGVCESASCR
jgi:hypothetical protein